MVFQNYALFPYLNVYQNIEYGLTIQRRPAKQVKATVAHYMGNDGPEGF